MFDLPDTLLIVAALLNIVLGILLLKQKGKSILNVLYLLNIASIVWWIVAIVIYRNTYDIKLLEIATINLYIAPSVIASTFLIFSLYFPFKQFKNITRYSIYIFCMNMGLMFLIIHPGLIIANIHTSIGQEHVIEFGPIYFVYVIYICGFFGAGMYILLRRYLRTNEPTKRRQIASLLLGYFLATSLALVTNLLLPWFGYFDLNWLGQVFTVFMVLPVTYAIYKHKLFETKVILTELLVLILAIFLFTRMLLASNTTDFLIDLSLLIAATIVGFLLVRSVNKEIKTREEIEKLAKSLARANKRLQAMDKQKSEFVSIASHQLRSPLTAIRGYASMLLEGSFGKFSKKAQQPLEHIAESARMMALSIEDYLSVSRIESGNMKYEYSDFNLKELASSVADDLRTEATKVGLVLSFKSDIDSQGIVHADKGKTQQILHNLVNNALKYTPKGQITVFVHDDQRKQKIHVEVIDTGIGMSEETQHSIFAKFQRAKDASAVNVHGTGLGLYVAKKMAIEMGGDITCYSEGEGEGSHFILHLPLKN